MRPRGTKQAQQQHALITEAAEQQQHAAQSSESARNAHATNRRAREKERHPPAP
eukprot:m.140054 g.140054  ORF g.140054 m.140054 type:complete len:54 (+) comp10007_c1_seq2:645-806(+)